MQKLNLMSGMNEIILVQACYLLVIFFSSRRLSSALGRCKHQSLMTCIICSTVILMLYFTQEYKFSIDVHEAESDSGSDSD